MKTHSPQRRRGTEKNEPMRNVFIHAGIVSIFSVSLCLCGSAFAVQAGAESLPGRLFYTPAQRAMLVNARAHKVTEIQKSYAPPDSAPVSFDGLITRSDGVAIRWINGRAYAGSAPAIVRDLKPGQTRAAKKIYEPYQLLRPAEKLPAPGEPAATPDKETAP